MKHPILFLGAASIALVATTSPTASAQSNTVEKRVDKLEKEMRAVQRNVFPGGAPTFFEGDIAPDTGATPPRSTNSTPVIELTARVDALESQLQILTGASEQNAFKLRELEQSLAAFKAETAARFASGEPVPPEGALNSTPSAPATSPLPVAARPASNTATRPASASAQAASRTETDRLALVKKVEVPVTGNEVDDAYNYGYRLWEAKLYPEAQTQLSEVVSKWPRHRMASYAQNLLGRAYLDENKPSLAAVAFYNNYKDRPQGARAPHSLMYMGVSLDRLNRKADACKAFQELEEVYGGTMPQDVRTDANAAKSKAGC